MANIFGEQEEKKTPPVVSGGKKTYICGQRKEKKSRQMWSMRENKMSVICGKLKMPAICGQWGENGHPLQSVLGKKCQLPVIQEKASGACYYCQQG